MSSSIAANTQAMQADSHKICLSMPDGSQRSYKKGITALAVAGDIGSGLSRDALAAQYCGALIDLDLALGQDGTFAIVTRKSEAALELIRHDCAHIMAMAVQQIYPNTQVTIGPVIENGFYYDFAREEPFTPEDFVKIEARMQEIIAQDMVTRREIWRRDDAISYFLEKGERYKAEIIRAIPENEDIRIYRHGPEWLDLCRGPHLASTGKIGRYFKLMKLAGAYWRGDSNNAMLQRIYGTAWRNKKELDGYLHRLVEAGLRDHRRIGRESGLFHQQEEAAGMVFWHPKGWMLWRVIESYMRRKLDRDGYVEVKTPQLIDRALWERSGHWEKFRENMLTAEIDEKERRTKRVAALKPMNCPGHVQIFKQGIKSWRDLPLRMAEFGSCHRYEPSGALHGLMRLRGFTQDDAHIFCREEQIAEESARFIDLLAAIYADFGFLEFSIKFSDRPVLRAGGDDVWDRAEAALLSAAQQSGRVFLHNPGEGAFYGPKLEFILRDAIGRDWQCGTLQVDFVLPEKLDAKYIASDGGAFRPVMLHRAILGSFERFIGILIEQYSGRFPLWLAPHQIMVLTVVSGVNSYAQEVCEAMCAAGLRAQADLRNEKISYKIREHSLAKVPILAIIGASEVEKRVVTLRRGKDVVQQSLALGEAISILVQEACPPDLRAKCD